MPRIIRHAPPAISHGAYSPGTGATYAALGQAAAHRNYGNYGGGGGGGMNPLWALGLGFAHQGMGQQFARQVHDQRQYDQQQAEHEAQQHANGFLNDLYQSAPDVIHDPEFQPFGSAIAHGVMHPKDAMSGYEAAKKSKAERDARDAQNQVKNQQANRGLDIREQGQQGAADYRDRNLALKGQSLEDAIRHRGVMENQGQSRIDNAASLHAMPKAGAIINDPEYRSAADSLKYHRDMAQLAQHQIDQSVFSGADATPLIAERDAHISAAKDAADQAQGVLKRMRTPGNIAPQAPAPVPAAPAVPPQEMAGPPVPAAPAQPQTDPRLTQHTLEYLSQNPNATDEEIKASFLQRYQTQE